MSLSTVFNSILALTLYFDYLVPGFISLFFFSFLRGKSFDESKKTLIKSVAVSYIYLSIYSFIFSREVFEFGVIDHIILIAAAFALPFILSKILKFKWFRLFMDKLGIDTELRDDILSVIKEKDTDGKGIVMKAYLDKYGLMYEGFLREHESDPEKPGFICLSGYRRYIEVHGEYKIDIDYDKQGSKKDKYWIELKMDNIDRLEIVYSDPK